MSIFQEQKAMKLTIDELAQGRLDGDLLNEFDAFLDFLRKQEAKFVLCAANKYTANYKGNGIAVIAIHAKNTVRIEVYTDKLNRLDDYFNAQTDEEIASLLTERLNSKCRQCRPTCGCSRGPGFNITVLGRQYEHICHGVVGFYFTNSGGNLQNLTLYAPGADMPGPPPVVRAVPMETVKKLILAKKRYNEMYRR